jgi:hypothetical protein
MPNLTFQAPVQGTVFNFGPQAGITSTGPNAVIHQDQRTGVDAAEALQLLAQLDALLAEARREGAGGADCETAEEAARQVTAAVKNPQASQAKEQAHGAMAVLEKTSQALGRFADIGTRFQKILTLLTPALTALWSR